MAQSLHYRSVLPSNPLYESLDRILKLHLALRACVWELGEFFWHSWLSFPGTYLFGVCPFFCFFGSICFLSMLVAFHLCCVFVFGYSRILLCMFLDALCVGVSTTWPCIFSSPFVKCLSFACTWVYISLSPSVFEASFSLQVSSLAIGSLESDCKSHCKHILPLPSFLQVCLLAFGS